MMRDELEQSTEQARALLVQIGNSMVVHTESVVGFARELAGHCPAVDGDLIEVAAWWHDTGRLYDKDHEQLSAGMAVESLAKLGISEAECRIVYDAIEFHRWSMSPQTLEGEIIRDADKLDWVSVSRWSSLLDEGRIETVENFSRSLASIRNEILHLEPSRPLFDRTLEQLVEFLRTTELPGLEPIVSLVLEYAARSGSS